MTESTGSPPAEILTGARLLHEFNNHLSVVVGFCDLLLSELPADDAKRADIVEMRRALDAAMALLPDLSARMR